MAGRPNYIVHAPGYDPDSGGSIFLHELVNALNQLGESAFLWPMNWTRPETMAERVRAVLRRPSLLWRLPSFRTNPALNTPVARNRDLRPDSIVVYPEVTLGNPLGARNVVRWLLYRPGLKDPYRFGPDEMFFRAGEMSDLPELTGGAPELFLWRINPAYRNLANPDRGGACYAVRKGAGKPRIAETRGAIPIDGLSHEEIADIFNRCSVFYSYDEATFYSQYAAICGCLSVVVPGLYSSREEWVASHPIARYGVAYGLDDLDHARQTQDQVLGLLQAKQDSGMASVRAFVTATMARFR
jgi:hypothetical protein